MCRKESYSVKAHYHRRRNAAEIWTQEARRHICRTLLMRFGPYEQWSKSHSPTDNEEEYNNCLEELARYFTAEFGRNITAGHGAVKQQIEYMIQSPVKAGKDQKDLSKVIVMCKSAALETGFVNSVWP